MVQTNLGKKPDAISKTTRTKSAQGMNQLTGHLPNKEKVLSSNPSTIKENFICYNDILVIMFLSHFNF
jgi:hypothetical protein